MFVNCFIKETFYSRIPFDVFICHVAFPVRQFVGNACDALFLSIHFCFTPVKCIKRVKSSGAILLTLMVGSLLWPIAHIFFDKTSAKTHYVMCLSLVKHWCYKIPYN